jgi:LacI family fructose operon transcriptional repressor
MAAEDGMEKRMASIKDVAAAAGVSTATVSRVLANSAHVRREVRERVLAAVTELGYRPNLVARSLRSQQSNSLGLIVSDIRNPYFTSVSRAVEDTAYAQGFSVLLCNTDEDAEKEAIYLRLMRDTNVAGVIVSPTQQTIATFSRLGLDRPTVVVDRAIPNADVDAVLLDNVDAAYRLTAHLIERGYRRIAALFGATSSTGRERRHGYELALRDHGLPLGTELARYVQPRTEAGYAGARDLLRAEPRPDAILTSNSLLGAGALQAIREDSLVIPDDVALVTFDDAEWTQLVEPPVTLIAQPTYEIGRTAAELVLARLAHPERPARQVILKGQLLVRASSSPRPHAVPAPAPA